MNLREYGREGNLETSAPSLTGIFYMQGEEYSMKKSGVLGLAVLLALAGGTAHAADVYEMEGIVVTATKNGRICGKSAGQRVRGHGKRD